MTAADHANTVPEEWYLDLKANYDALKTERDVAVQTAEQARNALQKIADMERLSPGRMKEIARAALAGNQT